MCIRDSFGIEPGPRDGLAHPRSGRRYSGWDRGRLVSTGRDGPRLGVQVGGGPRGAQANPHESGRILRERAYDGISGGRHSRPAGPLAAIALRFAGRGRHVRAPGVRSPPNGYDLEVLRVDLGGILTTLVPRPVRREIRGERGTSVLIQHLTLIHISEPTR